MVLAAAVVVSVDSGGGVQVAGGAGDEDPRFVSERRDYTSSPALRIAAGAALGHAGLDVPDIDAFDLYSCFPSAVELALDALGVAVDDPRPLTVTGGLPYAGGPGSGYALHSLAAMVNRIRSGTVRSGLVTGVGMAAAAHAVTVLAGPGAAPAATGRVVMRSPVSRFATPEVVDTMAGPATVETYTVEYERGGRPGRSILIVSDGERRTLAIGVDDPAFPAAIIEAEGVGLVGIVGPGPDGRNRFRLD